MMELVFASTGVRFNEQIEEWEVLITITQPVRGEPNLMRQVNWIVEQTFATRERAMIAAQQIAAAVNSGKYEARRP